MKKKIYAVLLLTAVCAGSGVFAQSSAPKENLEKYYTLERIRSKSGWLVSDNAAGLMLNQASLSIAEVNYDFEQGGLRNVTDGAEVNAFGVRSESYRRWNRLSFYGKLSYDYAASKDRSWAGNANIGDSPMLIGDSIPGNTRDETYAIEAGVAYRMGRWVVGAMGKYEDRSLAKRRDSRNKTTSMYLSVQPGVMFTSKVVDAGLNFTYERSTEQVGYAAFGTNTTSGMIYFFEGMWFYTSQQLGGSEKFYDVYYKGSEYGGAAQLELKLGKRVKFFNQFSAEYGKMERFRFDLDQHLGDNDQLTYRYLGVLNVAGRGVDQRLSVDASWLDAAGADGGVACTGGSLVSARFVTPVGGAFGAGGVVDASGAMAPHVVIEPLGATAPAGETDGREVPGGAGEPAGGAGPTDEQPGAGPATDPVLKPATTTPKTATTTKTTKTTVTKTAASTPFKAKTASAATATLPKTADSNWIAASLALFLLGTALLGAARRC